MEKFSILNSRNKRIVGNLGHIDYDFIVLFVHGFTNDKSSNGRFDSMASALNDDGFSTCAIDLTGSGESDDGPLTIENQSDDVKVTINYLLRCNYKYIVLFANSFGSVSCFNNYSENVVTMILTGPLTDSMTYNWHEFFTKEQLALLKQQGYFTLDNVRKHMIVEQTLKDFEAVNQDEIISKVQCPVLLIHGNNPEDQEELDLLSHSSRAIEKLPTGSKLKVIEGGKHGLRDEWDDVILLTRKWLKKWINK